LDVAAKPGRRTPRPRTSAESVAPRPAFGARASAPAKGKKFVVAGAGLGGEKCWGLVQHLRCPLTDGTPFVMSTMNVSLPDNLRSCVEEQVAARGYGTSSEYVRDLIRKDQDREKLRA
jgi:hypothetical protein